MGKIYKTLKVRIYPSKEQESFIIKTLGSCRFLYNQMLSERIQTYERLKGEDPRTLFEHKYKTEKEYKDEYGWLKEVDSISLQQSRCDLYAAYKNFFKSIKGKRKGEKIGFPKFHKKGIKDSYRTVMTSGNIQIDYESKKVKLPKLGWITYRDLRKNIDGKIKQVTVRRTATKKYFVSILFECDLNLKGTILNPCLKAKGLDMSMGAFFVDDQGNSPDYERIYRNNEPRLAWLQRLVYRKQKGSGKRRKAQMRVNILYERISNKRKDFIHKLSTQLVKENDVIVVESINLKGMARCLNLGKSVNDLGYGEFLEHLKYKSLWNDRIFIEADKWFASSKICSKCGYIHKDLKLGDREYRCANCGFEIDRDKNAGINLKNYGLRELGMGQPEYKPMENSMQKVDSVKWETLGSIDLG